MLMEELNPAKELLAMMQVRASHVLNTADIWGLGLFPYGSPLRTAHVYEARRFKGSMTTSHQNFVILLRWIHL